MHSKHFRNYLLLQDYYNVSQILARTGKRDYPQPSKRYNLCMFKCILAKNMGSFMFVHTLNFPMFLAGLHLHILNVYHFDS